jgi:hypothetical protein
MLWNQLLHNRTFFEKIHGMCKHCLMVVSISSFEMFTICLSNARPYFFILAFAHHHVAHSFVLSIALFHFVPHV